MKMDSDWKHITSDLKDHEKSVNHKECFTKWMDLATRRKKNEIVNECNFKKIKLEVIYWQNIKRIILVKGNVQVIDLLREKIPNGCHIFKIVRQLYSLNSSINLPYYLLAYC